MEAFSRRVYGRRHLSSGAAEGELPAVSMEDGDGAPCHGGFLLLSAGTGEGKGLSGTASGLGGAPPAARIELR